MKYVRSANALSKDIDGTVVILGTIKPDVYSANPVGARIWSLLASEHTLDDIVEHVCREFVVDVDTAKRDSEAYVQDLVRCGLIVAKPG